MLDLRLISLLDGIQTLQPVELTCPFLELLFLAYQKSKNFGVCVLGQNDPQLNVVDHYESWLIHRDLHHVARLSLGKFKGEASALAGFCGICSRSADSHL